MAGEPTHYARRPPSPRNKEVAVTDPTRARMRRERNHIYRHAALTAARVMVAVYTFITIYGSPRRNK